MTSRRCLLERTLASSLTWAGTPLATLANVVPSTPGRTALVIGNDDYRQNPLGNAVNDARAMASLLTQAGFAVDLKLNATREQMTDAIAALGRAVVSRDVGTALFYYAGHAAQLNWFNYLLPVDGNVESTSDIPKQCVDLGFLLSRLAQAKRKTALIILDACRDDPFGSRFRPPQKGMSQYDAPAGTLLAYATGPGSVAVELPGSAHGLYTEHLLSELSVRGVPIEDALKKVRLRVRVASNDKQVPWESTSLERDVYLFPTQPLSEAELERQLQEELETWRRIKGSPNPADWINYLGRYPNGRFAEAVQGRLRDMRAKKEPSLRPPAPGRAPALQLGPNLVVPERFKGSGNPNSAGTYPYRPVWTPGDEYVFHELDLYSGQFKGKYKLVIKRVDVANNRVELTNGSLVDLMGNVLKENRHSYDPPIQINPTELQIGRKWVSRYQQTGRSSGSGDWEFRITERQKVKVPAGEFSAFKIEGQGSFGGRPMHHTRWLVPGINFAVKREMRHAFSARVLVSARQAVSG